MSEMNGMEFTELKYEILKSRLKNQTISALCMSDDVICENAIASAIIGDIFEDRMFYYNTKIPQLITPIVHERTLQLEK